MVLDVGGLELGEEIGRGTAGIVFRATDTRTGEAVAVKLLHEHDPRALLDLKREVRIVRGVHHPGLVRLDELLVRGSDAALAMELVEGKPLTESLAEEPEQTRLHATRDAFRQLAAALHALHEHGVLHSDLKPSNVLRDRHGRVVVLDFGLASLASRGEQRGGSFAYSSPERLLNRSPGRAADWWAVGVMLFEATHARDPFPKPLAARLSAQRKGPPATSEHLSQDLTRLLRLLLSPHAEQRGGYAECVALLGGIAPAPTRGKFVGRKDELAALATVTRGVIHVRGPAGIGKSRLIEEWLATTKALVLHSRCHPDERVPFNAFDAVVDALAEELPHLWPEYRAPAELVTLFPTMDVLPRGDTEASHPSDPVELRLAAFRALAQLVLEVSRRLTTVLWLDDVQWADDDSAALLGSLMASGIAESILLVVSYRPSDSSVVERLRAQEIDLDLCLEPLPDADARAMLGDRAAVDDADLLATSGSPYLLTRLASRGPEPLATQVARLERRLALAVELISVGAPLAPEVLDAALDRPLERSALETLETEALVKRSARGRFEPWHDRLREELTTELSPATIVSRHASLADAWMTQPSPDIGALTRHLLGAKRPSEAVPWLTRAATDAEKQLAFDQAAEHYRTLSEITSPDADLLSKLGDALDRSGRAAQAADTWTDASRISATADQRRALQLLAGTRYLYAGRLPEGRSLLVDVLSEHDVRLPRWPLVSALGRRLWLTATGFRVATDTPDSSNGSRARALLGATKGLVMVEPVLADAVAVRALAEALSTGRASLIMEAMGLEAVSEANVGGPMLRALSRKLAARVAILADEVATPFASGWRALVRGCVAFFETRFDDALVNIRSALSVFREECVGAWHETNVAMAFLIASLACSGRYAELAQCLPELRADARARGDAYSWVALHTAETYFAAIVEDRVDAYLEAADAALAAWPGERFTSPHYQHFFATTSCLLYQGETEAAWDRVLDTWPKLRRAGFFQLEWLGGQLRHLRARAALLLARQRSSPALRRIAQSEARAILRSKLPGLRGLGRLVEAGLASGDARREAFARAELDLQAAGMHGFVRAATRVRDGDPDALSDFLVPAMKA